MLVWILTFWLNFFLSCLDRWKIKEPISFGFYNFVVKLIVSSWVYFITPSLLSWLLVKTDIFSDTPFDIINRFYHIAISPIIGLNGLLSSSCHPWHIHNALAFVSRGHQSTLKPIDTLKISICNQIWSFNIFDLNVKWR